MPKATPTVARLSADRDRRQRQRAQDEDEDEEGGEGDRHDDVRDPLPGDVAVVVELGGAAGDPGLHAGFLRRAGRASVFEALVEGDRAGRVEGVVGDHQHRAAWPPSSRSIASPGRFAFLRRRPVEGGEDEVAGVEEARRLGVDRSTFFVTEPAPRVTLTLGGLQLGLQRVGAVEPACEVRLQRFGAALELGDPAGEPELAILQFFQSFGQRRRFFVELFGAFVEIARLPFDQFDPRP